MKLGGILATGGNALPRSVVLEAREDGLHVQTGFGEPERLKWSGLKLVESAPGQFEIRRRFKRSWSIRLGRDAARAVGAYLDGGPPPEPGIEPEHAPEPEPMAPPKPAPAPQPDLEPVPEPEPELEPIPASPEITQDESTEFGSSRYRSGTASERWTGIDESHAPPVPEPVERYRTTASENWGQEEAELDEEGFSKLRFYIVGIIFAFMLIKSCVGTFSSERADEPDQRYEEGYVPIVPLPQQPLTKIAPVTPERFPADGARCRNEQAYIAIRRLLLRLWPDQAYNIGLDIISSSDARVTARPGGRIELTSGALQEFSTAELTTQLAHQVAHIQNRDLEYDDDSFSLEEEFAADERARRILIATRIDMSDGAAMLRRLSDLEAGDDPWMRSHFALHPTLPGQLDQWDEEAAMQQAIVDVPLLTAGQEEDLADACPSEAQTPPSR